MSTPTFAPAQQSVSANLTCRLRKRASHLGLSPTAGEVILENASADPLFIKVRSSLLEHLNLVVTDFQGKVISESHYGDLFSPMVSAEKRCLRPGEAFTAPVSLLATVPEEKRVPGRYQVQAVFEYDGGTAVSAPLQVEIPACP